MVISWSDFIFATRWAKNPRPSRLKYARVFFDDLDFQRPTISSSNFLDDEENITLPMFSSSSRKFDSEEIEESNDLSEGKSS